MEMVGMVQRASSLPPGLQVNPFWSRRTQDEVELRRQRPLNLPPVPGDDAEVERELAGEGDRPISGPAGSGEEGRGRVKSRDRDTGRPRMEKFATPASWAGQSKEASAVSEVYGPLGEKSEGMMPGDDDSEENTLERELEKEMVLKLHQENVELKKQLEMMQQLGHSRTTPSSWSVLTPTRGGECSSSAPTKIQVSTSSEKTAVWWRAEIHTQWHKGTRWSTT